MKMNAILVFIGILEAEALRSWDSYGPLIIKVFLTLAKSTGLSTNEKRQRNKAHVHGSRAKSCQIKKAQGQGTRQRAGFRAFSMKGG